MDNLKFYNMARTVPAEAKKPITAGRLKNMTDINPMWRIKMLTEMFGPCGVGWWYEITDKQIICDETTNQKAAFVDILLYYKDPESGKDSQGIPGTGGSSFVAQERNGPYMSDECFKMALTDAISVAAKAVGVAADVYYAADRTKYSDNEEQPQNEQQPRQQTQKQNGQQPQQQKQEGQKPNPRKMLIARLNELGIDVNAYAAEHGVNRNTTPEQFMQLLKELEGYK